MVLATISHMMVLTTKECGLTILSKDLVSQGLGMEMLSLAPGIMIG